MFGEAEEILKGVVWTCLSAITVWGCSANFEAELFGAFEACTVGPSLTARNNLFEFHVMGLVEEPFVDGSSVEVGDTGSDVTGGCFSEMD